MSEKRCPQCGAEIEFARKYCPECGANSSPKSTKILFMIVAVFVILIAYASTSQNSSVSETATATPSDYYSEEDSEEDTTEDDYILESEYEILENELATIKSSPAYAIAKNLSEEDIALGSVITTLNSKINNLKSTVSTLEKNIKGLKKDKKQLSSDLSRLKKNIIQEEGKPLTFSAGEYSVSSDIPKGRYKIYDGSSNFIVRDYYGDITVNTILDEENEGSRVREYIHQFEYGETIEASSSFKLIKVK